MATPPADDPLDMAAQAFLSVFQKAGAAAAAEVVRHVESEVKGVAKGLEKIAKCRCTPQKVMLQNSRGELQGEQLMHATDCPARD